MKRLTPLFFFIIMGATACMRVGFDLKYYNNSTDADSDDEISDVDTDHETPDDMVSVPNGTFMMGCNSAADSLCDSDEEPYHEVYLDTFEIEITEVTQQNYALCISAGACTPPSEGYSPETTPNYPVVFVNFDQAQSYCEWLGRRLPTEAEWEKAARGTDGRIYPWRNTAPDCTKVNFNRCEDSVIEVGSFPDFASPYGLMDMAGNASEWTADFYQADYYAESPASNPTGPETGLERTVRGSSYYYDHQSIRTSNRIEREPESQNGGRGFRCAASVP